MGRIAAILILLVPAVAHAQWEPIPPREGAQIGVDGGAALVRSEGSPFSAGGAGGIRLGYHFRNEVTPDMQLGFVVFSGNGLSEYGVSFMPGVRWGWVTDRFYTGASAHVGYGLLNASANGQNVSLNGLALELGFDLAFQLTREVTVGPHFSIDDIIVSKTGPVEVGEFWFNVGLGFSFTLPSRPSE
jgi:hypothetical protein